MTRNEIVAKIRECVNASVRLQEQVKEYLKVLEEMPQEKVEDSLEDILSVPVSAVNSTKAQINYAIDCYNVCVDAYKKHMPRATREKLDSYDPTNPLLKRIMKILKNKTPKRAVPEDFVLVINDAFCKGKQPWNDSLEKIINEKFGSKWESATNKSTSTFKPTYEEDAQHTI